MPYLFYGFCGVSLFAILRHYNVLQYVSAWTTIPAWKENIKNIFSSMYCDWLGATWFLTSLFMAYIFSKICLILDKNRTGVVYILSVFFLFNMGYYYHNQGINPVFLVDWLNILLFSFIFQLGTFTGN